MWTDRRSCALKVNRHRLAGYEPLQTFAVASQTTVMQRLLPVDPAKRMTFTDAKQSLGRATPIEPKTAVRTDKDHTLSAMQLGESGRPLS